MSGLANCELASSQTVHQAETNEFSGRIKQLTLWIPWSKFNLVTRNDERERGCVCCCCFGHRFSIPNPSLHLSARFSFCNFTRCGRVVDEINQSKQLNMDDAYLFGPNNCSLAPAHGAFWSSSDQQHATVPESAKPLPQQIPGADFTLTDKNLAIYGKSRPLIKCEWPLCDLVISKLFFSTSFDRV